MQDMKTTLTGIITGVLSILAAFHVALPAFLQGDQGVGIIAGIGAMVLGYFAKDGGKTN